jgi:hypothetical protein
MKKIVFSSLACIISGAAVAQSAPEVTPYRPGAAAGSAISAPGYFETEFSFDTAKGGGARADVFGGLLKYSFSSSTGLIFGVPILRLSGNGFGSESGLADSTIGLKHVVRLNDTNAMGFQLTSTLPTGKRQFRSDDPTVGLTGIYGADFSGFHADLNLGARFNTADVGDSMTFVWVAGLGRPIGNGLGWYLEASGNKPKGGSNATTVLGALTYTVSKNLALDASVSRARTDGVNSNGVGVGMTYLFAR